MYYHGSRFISDDGLLMPGFKRSGELVRWDGTESNKWLYATKIKALAESLGIATALEKQYNTTRFNIENNVVTIWLNNKFGLTEKELYALEVYIYEIEERDEDGWVPVNNHKNSIEDEWKTTHSVEYGHYYRLDIRKWFEGKKIVFKQHKLNMESLFGDVYNNVNKEHSMEELKEDLTLESSSYTPTEDEDNPGWFKIPGYPYFLASRKGELMNKKTGYTTKGSKDDRGYMRACIWNNEKEEKKDVKVHVLICTAFHGPAPKDHEVGHKDDIRDNNLPSNLHWTTREANMKKRHTMESSIYFNW